MGDGIRLIRIQDNHFNQFGATRTQHICAKPCSMLTLNDNIYEYCIFLVVLFRMEWTLLNEWHRIIELYASPQSMCRFSMHTNHNNDHLQFPFVFLVFGKWNWIECCESSTKFVMQAPWNDGFRFGQRC